MIIKFRINQYRTLKNKVIIYIKNQVIIYIKNQIKYNKMN